MSPTGRALLIAPAVGPVIAGFLFYLFVDNEIEILIVYTPALVLISYLAMGIGFLPAFKFLRKRQWAGWLSLVPLAVVAQILTLFVVWILFVMSLGGMPWQAIGELFANFVGRTILHVGLAFGAGMGVISGFVFWWIARTDPAYKP